MAASLSNNSFDFTAGADEALAAIFSVEGPVLSDRERDFFRAVKPFGFILFARNCVSPDQLRKLTADLKQAVGWECPVLIDQEGGRVQRLKAPVWRAYPPMRRFGERADDDEAQALDDLRFAMMQLGEELRDGGINVNCAPVLDVLQPETHEVIGDRAFSDDPSRVARMGMVVCQTMMAAGITPVIKHIPGHGRATLDSHHDLPVVSASRSELEAVDFKPFKEIAESALSPVLWGMAAHMMFTDLDPQHPSTLSPVIIRDVIRGHMGFEGLLLTDDIDMQALARYGDAARRSVLALEAGCDVALYCAGKLEIMEKIANSVPKLTSGARKRLQKAAEFRKLAASMRAAGA